MSESPRSEPSNVTRRRWISLGEFIALAALVISALGLWNGWRDGKENKPAAVPEKISTIRLALRGTIADDGRSIIIAPVESRHALESLSLSADKKPSISIGGDGRLSASDVQQLVSDPDKNRKPGSLRVKIEARYIEAGSLKRGGGTYRISYRWDDGGLFGSDKIRLTGFNLG